MKWKPRVAMMPTLLSLVAIANGGTKSCHYTTLWCHQWQQGHDDTKLASWQLLIFSIGDTVWMSIHDIMQYVFVLLYLQTDEMKHIILYILSHCDHILYLTHCDVIWWHRSGLTLGQVTAFLLDGIKPSLEPMLNYRHKCSGHLPESSFTRSAHEVITNREQVFKDCTYKINWKIAVTSLMSLTASLVTTNRKHLTAWQWKMTMKICLLP